MEYKYDPEADCAYILINDLPHAYSKEVDVTRFVDYAEDGTVIGIELLYIGSGVDVTGLPCIAEIKKLLEESNVKVFGEE